MLPLLALGCLSAAACDRELLDPALRDGDEAALLRAAGLGRPESRYTLPGMVLEARRELDRTDGVPTARQLLEVIGQEQAAALAAAQAGDAAAAAAAQEALRQAELAMVVEVLGESGAAAARARRSTRPQSGTGTSLRSAPGRPTSGRLSRRRVPASCRERPSRPST
ncbi:MAG: hypothetical protein FIB01_04255 [Gemmatimonadetes bacterium]|nr:hypothetical protein [Gemmatimonadota bacterium]